MYSISMWQNEVFDKQVADGSIRDVSGGDRETSICYRLDH